MRIDLVKSSFYRQGTQLNREVESKAQGHIWATWWSQNWNPVTLTTDGICLLWPPSLPRSPRSHKQVVAEPELLLEGTLLSRCCCGGTTTGPLLSSDDPGSFLCTGGCRYILAFLPQTSGNPPSLFFLLNIVPCHLVLS